MPNKRTRESVIREIVENYGDLFSFGKFIYKSLAVKSIFTCKIHGDIEIRPISLLGKQKSKYGCSECYLEDKTMSFESWCEEAKKVHSGRYEYSYNDIGEFNKQKKITLHCDKHGDSNVQASSHINSKSLCNSCAIEDKYSIPREKIIDKFLSLYEKYNYDYSLLVNETYLKKDTITYICPKHGIKTTTVEQHEKHKCLECSQDDTRKSQSKWIEESVVKHKNKYDYSLVEYRNNITKVQIICPKHGKFEQYPNSHLSGHGCKECSDSLFFMGKNEYEYFIPYIKDKISYEIKTQYKVAIPNSENYFMVDVFIPSKNIVIEYDEDYHYKDKQLYKDKKREEYITEKLGCEFIRVKDEEFMVDNTILDKILEEKMLTK